MADYRLNGTSGVRKFMRDSALNEALLPNIAASVNVPVIHFANRNGQTATSFTRRITQAQAEALAAQLSSSVATLASEGILTELP